MFKNKNRLNLKKVNIFLLIATIAVVLLGIAIGLFTKKDESNLKDYRDIDLGIHFLYPSNYFLTKNKNASNTSIDIYTSKSQKIKFNLFKETLDSKERVFHILIMSHVDNKRMFSYLGVKPEPKKLEIGGNTWTVYKIKDLSTGSLVIEEMTILETINNGIQYEVNIDSLEISDEQIQILKSLNLNFQ